MKFSELQTMSDEHLVITLKEAKDALFRLKIQARMERLESVSELHKHKKMIARIYTLQRQRTTSSN